MIFPPECRSPNAGSSLLCGSQLCMASIEKRFLDRDIPQLIREFLLKLRANPQSVSTRNINEQVKQANAIHRRAVHKVVNQTVITDEVWSGIRRIFATAGGNPVNGDRATVRDVAFSMQQLREEFYAKNGFSAPEVTRHRHKLDRRWAKRYLGLAIRRNGKRDLLCRAELIRWAARLYISSVLPEGGRVCTLKV